MIHSCQKKAVPHRPRQPAKQNGVCIPPPTTAGNRTPLSVAATGPPLGAMRYAPTSASAVPSTIFSIILLFLMIITVETRVWAHADTRTVAVHHSGFMH
jgi:hypothetical protein